MSERLNKTSICSIVFLDIIEYSKKPDFEQIRLKERFNNILSEALKDVAQNDRIILDTGDGAAIAMMGEPESALFVALTIRDDILRINRERPDYPLGVLIGINLGPVRVVKDINDHVNIIGDGINTAQRVMSFAEPNQILVSRSYYEIVSRLSDDILKMFAYSGVKHDKHVREHEVYVILPPREEETGARPAEPVQRRTAAGARNRLALGLALIAALVLAIAGAAVFLDKSPPPDPLPVPELPAPKETEADTPQAVVEKFIENPPHGTSQPECTDAQRSLNQCK